MRRLNLFFRLVRDAWRASLDQSQCHDTEEIQMLLMELPGVEGVHNLCLERVNGSARVTFHLVTKKRRPCKVIARVRRELGMRGIDATTIEWCVVTGCSAS